MEWKNGGGRPGPFLSREWHQYLGVRGRGLPSKEHILYTCSLRRLRARCLMDQTFSLGFTVSNPKLDSGKTWVVHGSG